MIHRCIFAQRLHHLYRIATDILIEKVVRELHRSIAEYSKRLVKRGEDKNEERKGESLRSCMGG